jgi:hypothetical protein
MIGNSGGTVPEGVGPGELRDLQRLRDRLEEEASRVRRDDLVALLGDLRPVETAEPIRACVVGETKRGKSSLLNAMVGRPLLSPVGVDVTTSCWVEVCYGDPESAEVILADPRAPDRPIRRTCAVADLERYVALDHAREPVIGVQVRIPAPVLRDLVLVDTPGVGGLLAGHTATTLAALRKADALLFVCESGQPILAPELGFLVKAACRVPTVVVAVTKRDIDPEFELVVEETRQRIAATHGLGDVPVLAVAAPLADLAAEIRDEQRSSRLRTLSGIEPLLDTLRGYSSSGAALVRFENAARVLAEVCRALVARSDEIVEALAGNTERTGGLRREMDALQRALDDTGGLTALVRDRLDQLRREQIASFDGAVESLRPRYRAAAERGTAADLTTLASRMVGELSAAAVDSLEGTARRCTQVVADVMRQLGAGDRWPMTPATASVRFEIGLDPPETSTQRGGVDLVASAEMFTKLVNILTGSALVMTALGGPVVIAAGVGLAAGAGYYKASRGNEPERRAALVAWVDEAADQARAALRREIDNRLRNGEQHVDQALPHVLATRRHELSRLAAELDAITSSTADLRGALADRRASATALQGVEREIDELVSWASAARGRRAGP